MKKQSSQVINNIQDNFHSNQHSNIKIIKIDYALAFRIGNKIYLNKNLDKYKLLKEAIIKHELSHTSGFGLSDILTDLTGKHLKKVKRDYYKFLFTEKKAWYQFIPIMKIDGKWSIDLIMLIVWIMIISTTSIFYRIIT